MYFFLLYLFLHSSSSNNILLYYAGYPERLFTIITSPVSPEPLMLDTNLANTCTLMTMNVRFQRVGKLM